MNPSEISKARLDQFENRLDTLARRTTQRLFFAFAVLLLAVALIVTLLHRSASQINGKIDGFAARNASQPTSVPAGRDDARVQALEGRLQSLEQLQEAMVSASKGALEQMNFVFAFVGAFFGLIALYFAYRQMMADTGRDKHDQEMRGLVGSFRENMSVINSLISTMEKGFEHRAIVDRQLTDIGSHLSEIEKFKSAAQKHLQERIADLNREAWVLSGSLNRENFKDEANRGALEHFYVTTTALERMEDVRTQFTPFVFFIRALHFFNATQYPMASRDFEESRGIINHQIMQPAMHLYVGSNESEVRERLKQILTDCCYHLGIIYYNLGAYENARRRFTEAYERDSADLRSRAYIPELLFFESRVPFGVIMDEFDAVEREFKAWLTKEGRGKVNLDANLAALLLRRGNCYLPKSISPPHHKYRDDENGEQARLTYQNALVHARRAFANAAKASLTEIFVRFSLAQAMVECQHDEWEGKSLQEHYTDVFYDLRRQASSKTEPIVLTLLNYAMAVCVATGRVPNESPSFYLARAREYLTRVPPEVRVFSPVCKINLAREEFLVELDEFEQQARGTDATPFAQPKV